MKRRAVKDTPENREVLVGLGYSFIENHKRGRIFIKTTNGDFAVIKELLPESPKEGEL